MLYMRDYPPVWQYAQQFAACMLPEPERLPPLTPADFVMWLEGEANKVGQNLGDLCAEHLEIAGGARSVASASDSRRHRENGRCSVIEEYTRRSDNGRLLRIQVVAVSDGYMLTHAEELGRGPVDLRGYLGGWQLAPPRLYKTRDALQRRLDRNGWTLHLKREAECRTR
jgi:hypothetical protein